MGGMPGMQTGIPASINTATAILPTSNTPAVEVPSSLFGVSPPTLEEVALVSNATVTVSSASTASLPTATVGLAAPVQLMGTSGAVPMIPGGPCMSQAVDARTAPY